MGPRTDVALNVYLEGGAWNHEWALIDANVYADTIADAVGLRVHFATADTPTTFQELAGSRFTRAVDAVMTCNGCGHDEALNILSSASTSSNVGLEEVAATVLLALTDVTVTAALRSDG